MRRVARLLRASIDIRNSRTAFVRSVVEQDGGCADGLVDGSVHRFSVVKRLDFFNIIVRLAEDLNMSQILDCDFVIYGLRK